MQQIGIVKFVQVQTGSLKVTDGGQDRFDPSALLTVQRLELTADGVIGFPHDGEPIVDIHNARHPQTKNVGTNPVSIGFTAHYRAMRDRFGSHMQDGIGGENILIETDHRYRLDELGSRVLFHNPTSGQTVSVSILSVALPCVPFSTWASSQSAPLAPEQIKSALQFLNNGTRGFYVTPSSAFINVQAGDTVYLEA